LVHLPELLLWVRLLLHALNAADPRVADRILNFRETLWHCLNLRGKLDERLLGSRYPPSRA
jgi:hypothetical protein